MIRGLACALLLCGFSQPLTAQDFMEGAENVPGRIFYHCRKYFGAETDARGGLEADKHLAEDGSLIRMRVNWYAHIHQLPMIDANADIEPLFGGRRRGMIQLEWQSQEVDGAAQFDWENPMAGIRLTEAIRTASLGTKGDEPWRQTFFDRSGQLNVIEYEDKRYIFPDNIIILSSGLQPATNWGLRAPLANLLAWGHGVDQLTVYETRVGRREFRRGITPSSPGPHRVVAAFTMRPQRLAELAQTIEGAVKEWEASIGDHTEACDRREEVDEPNVILVN